MELQLGLSLPAATVATAAPFDLNGAAAVERFETWKQNESYYTTNNKRGFDQAFFPCTTPTTKSNDHVEDFDCGRYEDRYSDHVVNDRLPPPAPETIITLPLFVWSSGRRRQPDDEDDGYRNGEEEDDGQPALGWPPVRTSWRKKKLLIEVEDQSTNYDYDHQANLDYGPGLITSRLVKVKMEGVGIIRKIDLNLYHSYPALVPSLLLLFAKHCQNNNDGVGNYRVMYQDKAGDWLIAGDVNWQKFVRSVQRIEIFKGKCWIMHE